MDYRALYYSQMVRTRSRICSMRLPGKLPNVKAQVSPQYSHHSQGVVERYHQTLFAQLSTLKFSLSQNYGIDTR
eukprot:5543626-Amphidinium_carterae.1